MADTVFLTGLNLYDLNILDRQFPEADLTKLPDTPHETFRSWLEEAIKADVKEPHTCTLSTVDSEGRPDARIISLTRLDNRGWHFTIRGDGPKAQQIDGNKNVALTFYWPQVGRQIRLRGKASRQSEEECSRDLLKHPLYSRIAAVASKQSQVLQNRGELLCRVADVKIALAEGTDPSPPERRVYASSVEFWQRSNDRLHQRLRYTVGSGDGDWVKELLWP
ncbi:Pyridoxine/pyridoxamine 5'-phosphate oxidase [Talaromyces pinophilus]|nr:Pyridoxine/pyridoxamine 5'-phosphate oxidase [Talaromyces pinophilus]